jgi:Methyltransferase small domain
MTEPATFVVDEADLPGPRYIISKLDGIGYSERSIRECLGLSDLTDLQWRCLPMYRAEQLAARDPLASAIDLFLLQGSLPIYELERLFVESERDVLMRAGLLAIDPTGIARARASLFPIGNRLIFSDHAWPGLPHPGQATVPFDQVMPIGLDSRRLAHCTSRRPVRSALDLCTGSGIHALLASAHAAQVIAVDINPRAARAHFNTWASGIANLEIAVSDLFDAVRGKRFDLITANPRWGYQWRSST